MKVSILLVLSVLFVSSNARSYFIEKISANSTNCAGGISYESVQYPLNTCLLVDAASYAYQYFNETVVNSTGTVNVYFCNGQGSCPNNCNFAGSYTEECIGGGSQETSFGTTNSDIITGDFILAAYGQDSTCTDLVQAQAIGDYFKDGNGICLSGQKFGCSGNIVTLEFCSSADCTTGCTLNGTAPLGGCWNDIFSLGQYFRLSCGAFNLATGTVVTSSTTTTTGTATQTAAQICAASNVADWTYGSGYYCYNGGSAFVQCYGSGNGVIACPAGTSCHCAPGVECSDHGMSSPCTF